MTLYEREGFTLTSDDLAVLAYLAGHGRKALGTAKSDAEHTADDILWSLGWFVPSRTSPDERTQPHVL